LGYLTILTNENEKEGNGDVNRDISHTELQLLLKRSLAEETTD